MIIAIGAHGQHPTQSKADELGKPFPRRPACPAMETRRGRGGPSRKSEEQMLRPRPREQGSPRGSFCEAGQCRRLRTADRGVVDKASDHEGQCTPY